MAVACGFWLEIELYTKDLEQKNNLFFQFYTIDYTT